MGVLNYDFGNFEVLITAPLTAVSGNLAKETASDPAAHELAVGTFNVENLDPAVDISADVLEELARVSAAHAIASAALRGLVVTMRTRRGSARE